MYADTRQFSASTLNIFQIIIMIRKKREKCLVAFDKMDVGGVKARRLVEVMRQ